MLDRFKRSVWIGLVILLIGCAPAGSAVTATSAPAATGTSTVCVTQLQVVNAFFDANDAGNIAVSLGYLTDDAILVFWAEGINGHHMGQTAASGADQLRPLLARDGLRRNRGSADLPIYTMEEVQQMGNQLFFKLTPDRPHVDGRPYDPYVVEMIFKGCKIDIIKLVERITWV